MCGAGVRRSQEAISGRQINTPTPSSNVTHGGSLLDHKLRGSGRPQGLWKLAFFPGLALKQTLDNSSFQTI